MPSPVEPTKRLGHVVMDLPSRQWKAMKIERLLDLDQRPGPLRLLEVGTGSGGIAHYFATHPSGRFTVDAVDVEDTRLVSDAYRYTLVAGTSLPFEADSFDVVLSNHVIEHVGDTSQQLEHLAELRRVLHPDGIGYLAVPNRWMLVEPHYRLIFLSWLPKALRSPYLRLAGKGQYYDCLPMRLGELEEMLRESSLQFRNQGTAGLRATLDIEKPASIARRLMRHVPNWVPEMLGRLNPTLIYRFWRE